MIAAAANAARGEVIAVLAGAERRLCLTLGALAELETAFGLSGWEALASAASTGKLSLGDLAKAGVAATEALAGGSMASVSSAAGGLGAALGSALGSVLSSVFGGARADGGAVAAGSAYLVGERGPELFRPGVSGQIDAVPGGGATINLNLSGVSTPSAFARSEAQIAQALARAASLGAPR